MVTMPWALALILCSLALLGLGEYLYILALRVDVRTLGRQLARTHVEASRHSTSHSGYEELRSYDTRRRHP